MADKHEFFPQPRGLPSWCFCRSGDCSGWVAYLVWYQGSTNGDTEPDDNVIETHRLINKELTTLLRRYRDLFGVELDFNTALDLADIERAAESGRPETGVSSTGNQ